MTEDEQKKLTIGAAIVTAIAAITGYFAQTEEQPPPDPTPPDVPVWDDNGTF